MSDSEDGQLQSPGNEDDELMSTGMDDIDDEDDEERDADSLNIKPPQAIVVHNRDRDSHGLNRRHGKDKISSKDKKHSKERRHKERNSLKERQRDVRAERERREFTSSAGGVAAGNSSSERRRDERGGGATSDMERYQVRGSYDRNSDRTVDDGAHDSRRGGYARYFDRNESNTRSNHYHHQHYHQQQQYHGIQHMQHQRQQHHQHDYYERTGTYHNHRSTDSGGGGAGSGGIDYHSAGRQYNKHSGNSGGASYVGGNHHHDDGLTAASGERERDRVRDRDRRKYDQPAKDAESLEQDLRSRLLSKRHRYVRTSGGDETDDRYDDAAEYEKSHSEPQRVRSRREKKREGGGGGAGNSSVIEVLDSPEIEPKSNHHHKSRHRHKHRSSDASPGATAIGATIIDKRKNPDDPELLARRAKFLAAEREKELRKESAREELQARREILRKGERHSNDNATVNISGALSPSAVAASVTAGLNVIKRNVNEESSERQSKRKRSDEKQNRNVDHIDDDEVEHDNSELEESDGDGGLEDDDSVSLSVSEDDDSDSHSGDSGAQISVKSISPPPPTKSKRKHSKRQRVVGSDRESSRSRSKSKDHSNRKDDDDVDSSDHSYYEKTVPKKKTSKKSKIGDIAVYNDKEVAAVHSDIDSRSASPSPVESEDSFYANRKREKRAKGDDDESSPERRMKDFYRSNKSAKAPHKSKKSSKDKRGREEPDEASESPISEGSIKAHRTKKSQKKKSPGNNDSVSRSEVSDMESDDTYYEKKKHRRRHHRKMEKEDKRKLQHSGRDNDSEISASSVSEESQENEDENDGFGNGVHDASGSDNQHTRKSKRRKYSHEANQFLADINDVDMKDLSKDETKKCIMRDNGAQSGTDGSVTVADNEVVTIYDDKGVPLPNYYPGIQGCRTVEEFQCLNRIEEGTYGVVYRARDQRTNEIVALKRLKMEKEREGFPITSLREINTLLKGQHPNIVTVREIVVGSNMDKIFIVMDYVEHDLKSLMETMKTRKQIFFPGEVKCLTQQLLRAVGHLHDNWILHRDLKTSNLLLSHKGILKVGDFGLAREYGSPLRKYTSLVVTRWYRAPELLLCSSMYSTPIDIWSVGCIFAEFLLMTPYLPGKSDIDQLNRIFRELGTPNEKIWPGYNELPAVKNVLSQNTQFADYPMSNLRKRFNDKVSEAGMSLLQGLLTYDPKQRLTAEAALEHTYFKELPLPIDPAMFPTWPAKSEMGSARKAAHSPKPPSGGAQFKQLGQDDIAINVGKSSGTTGSGNQGSSKVVSGIITGNKKTASNTGFVLNAGIDQRQLAMGPGFNLKF